MLFCPRGFMPAPCDSTSPALPHRRGQITLSTCSGETLLRYDVTQPQQQIGPWSVRAHEMYNNEYDDMGVYKVFFLLYIR
jgi:hypothetical protein